MLYKDQRLPPRAIHVLSGRGSQRLEREHLDMVILASLKTKPHQIKPNQTRPDQAKPTPQELWAQQNSSVG